VNYSDYAVSDITVHVLGKFKKVTLMRPEVGPHKLDVYEVERAGAGGFRNADFEPSLEERR